MPFGASARNAFDLRRIASCAALALRSQLQDFTFLRRQIDHRLTSTGRRYPRRSLRSESRNPWLTARIAPRRTHAMISYRLMRNRRWATSLPGNSNQSAVFDSQPKFARAGDRGLDHDRYIGRPGTRAGGGSRFGWRPGYGRFVLRKNGSPGRIRTSDQPVNSRLLYR